MNTVKINFKMKLQSQTKIAMATFHGKQSEVFVKIFSLKITCNDLYLVLMVLF